MSQPSFQTISMVQIQGGNLRHSDMGKSYLAQEHVGSIK